MLPLIIDPSIVGGADTVLRTDPTERAGSTQGNSISIWDTIKKDIPDMVNAVIASSGVCNSQGLTGGFALYNLPLYCRIFYTPQAATDNARWGKPLCAKDYIRNHSGYVLCATGEVNVNATKAERQDIAAYLTGGIYYE